MKSNQIISENKLIICALGRSRGSNPGSGSNCFLFKSDKNESNQSTSLLHDIVAKQLKLYGHTQRIGEDRRWYPIGRKKRKNYLGG